MMLKQKSEYGRYYGDFRGVDFSSDHTLVNASRFPYLVNMYKDYASGGGQGIETIPGFRRRFAAPNGARIYGIHSYNAIEVGKDGEKMKKRKVLVHAGEMLYDWKSFPNAVGVTKELTGVVGEYDEYSATSVDNVRIEDFHTAHYRSTITADSELNFVVRAIKKVGSDTWISVESEKLFDGEQDFTFVEGAYEVAYNKEDYTNRRGETTTYKACDIKIKSVITNAVGDISGTFGVGDTIYLYVVTVGEDGKYSNGWISEESVTVDDYNEYEEDDATDYLAIRVEGLEDGDEITSIKRADGSAFEKNYNQYGNTLLVKKGTLGEGEKVTVNTEADKPEELWTEMNLHESVSFVMNNRLYIIDGKNYLVYDGESVSRVCDNAYIPTTYINIIPDGENADTGREYESRNMLQPKFKHTFIADGETTEFYMNEKGLDSVDEVKVYGEVLNQGVDYKVDLEKGKITFLTAAPTKPEETPMESDEKTDGTETEATGETTVSEGEEETSAEEDKTLCYPEMYAGVEITASRDVYPAVDGGETTSEDFRSMLEGATVACVFDNRVFLSGIPDKPNLILWSHLSAPDYFGVLNYVSDGVGNAQVTAMLPLANTLLVLKGDTEFDGAVYYHTPHETGIDVMPKTYPSEAGLAGIGCLGAACNFLDDPVFVSRLGVEAIGQLSVRYERAREHRSSLVDAKLVNLSGIRDAKLCEWGGYLVLLADGKIFLADSRQVYQNDRGEAEYEWYYLEDIGVYDGQCERFKYVTEWPELFMETDENNNVSRKELIVIYNGVTHEVKLAKDVFPDGAPVEVSEKVPVVYGSTEIGEKTYGYYAAMYPYNNSYVALMCDGDGEMVGGSFCPAVTVKTIDDGECENLFFGTTNGVVCSFNFDKRKDGAIPAAWYTFDGRTIYSGCALKMDNCDIPHMTKTTVKKSTVIKVKSFQSTAAKVRVRTNVNPYNEIARINGTRFSFDNMDFSDFSFVCGEDTLFAIKEKEKKWVEKQWYIYSDEFKKPFALYYLAYRWYVSGKYKK